MNKQEQCLSRANPKQRPDYPLALQNFLVLTVPPEMRAILQRGGINDRDLAWLQQEENEDSKDFRFANVLAKADGYLLYPKDVEVLRQSLLVLRKAIAIMALFPSGIAVFGYHFGVDFDGFVIHEDDWLEWYAQKKQRTGNADLTLQGNDLDDL